MAIRFSASRTGAARRDYVSITAEDVGAIDVEHEREPDPILDDPWSPDTQFRIHVRDKRGRLAVLLSRDEARDLARKILDATEILCDNCGVGEVTDEQYHGMCIDCYIDEQNAKDD